MKVLLYAVFNDHEGLSGLHTIVVAQVSHCHAEPVEARGEVRSLKAEQCSTLTLALSSGGNGKPLL